MRTAGCILAAAVLTVAARAHVLGVVLSIGVGTAGDEHDFFGFLPSAALFVFAAEFVAILIIVELLCLFLASLKLLVERGLLLKFLIAALPRVGASRNVLVGATLSLRAATSWLFGRCIFL